MVTCCCHAGTQETLRRELAGREDLIYDQPMHDLLAYLDVFTYDIEGRRVWTMENRAILLAYLACDASGGFVDWAFVAKCSENMPTPDEGVSAELQELEIPT